MNEEKLNLNIEEYTSKSISKFWKLLNYSNDITKKQIANIFFSNLKEKYKNYLEISIELFNTAESIQDKIISSILIHQYIKENYNKFIDNEILFNNTKDFLIRYINNTSLNINIFSNNEESLIIERICYSLSILVIIGCFTYWPNCIEELLKFGKQNINYSYIMTIILGNINEEFDDIFLSKKQENQIKEKFVKNKENFFSFINTILLYSNADKKLYNKTIILSKNLVIFGINVLLIPKMINIMLENINEANIDYISKLISKCIEYSNCKKLEDDLNGLDLSEYDNRMNKDELLSINLIIEYIYNFINNNSNINYNNKIIFFELGKIISDIIENFIYLMFKKDNISQKLLNLFYFFVSSKSKIISQLFFESILVMKNFINACYKFNNYSKEEKIEFSNFLLKICQNIIFNCTFKKIENQEILFKEENICINHDKNEEDENYNIKEEKFLSGEEEIDEIPTNEYRANAEDSFFNIFLIFATNFLSDGINYYFKIITKPIIPLLSQEISLINTEQILSLESIIFSIKSIINAFETLIADKTPLMQFILLLIKSNIVSHDFIYSNVLLLLEEASMFFNDEQNIYEEIIIFILSNINNKINLKNKEMLIQLSSAVLLSICSSCENNYFNNNIWEKMLFIYNNYYNIFNELALYNITESICSSLTTKEKEEINLINYYNKIIEMPLINIKKIGEIISNDENLNEKNELLLNKEIKKNINVITRILKQASFIEDKSIINSIFNIIYTTSFSFFYLIIHVYISHNDIVTPFLKMLTKASFYFNNDIINKVFINLNQFLLDIFSKNNDNFQSIYVLKNIYVIKLNNMNKEKKVIKNEEYNLILNNFLQLNRQLCSDIINIKNSENQLELIQCLATLFNYIFPLLDEIKKDDYIILFDTIIVFIEAIKTVCENNIIKNILISFSLIIKSKKDDLIKFKLNEIIISCFSSIEHYNNNVINIFINFCYESINYNKTIFLNSFNQVLLSNDFNFLNDIYKKVIYDYVEYFCYDINKLKEIIIDIMNISKKIKSPDIIEEYYNELRIHKNII